MRARTPMRGLIAVSSAIVLGGWAITSAAQADPPGSTTANAAVCQPQGDHQFPSNGSTRTLTYTAPAGFLVSGYCVKAGSAQQGNGPVYVVLDAPVASVTITHPSGKDISHYTVTLVPVTTPTPTPTLTASPSPSPSVTSTSTPAVTPTDSASATPSTTSPTTSATTAPSATSSPTVLGEQATDDSPELDTSTASDDDTPVEPTVEVKGVQATAGKVTVPTVIAAGR